MAVGTDAGPEEPGGELVENLSGLHHVTVPENVGLEVGLVVALGALTVVIVCLLTVIDRMGKRHHEENQAHRLEVAGLCQRIQDPETAVLQHAAETVTSKEGPLFHNEFSDDEQALRDLLEPVEDR